MDHATDLRGFLVVASAEGIQLGSISAIYIDPEQKRVSALAFRTRRLGGDEFYVPMSAVQNIGRDVILISTETAVCKITDTDQPPGRSLKELQGFWVTTDEGHHLGPLIDLDFSNDWKICALTLTDDRDLAVNPDEIKIGDEILVPEHYAVNVRKTNGSGVGLLRRIFGGETVDDTKKVLKRARSRSSEQVKDDEQSDQDKHVHSSSDIHPQH